MMRRIFTLTCLALLPTSGLLSALESTRSGLSHEASAGELKRMEAEPVVFCKDLEARLARLLFEPTKIIRVQRANQSQVYEEGVDFTLEGRTLRLTKNSRIPMLQYYSQKQIEDLYRFKEPKGFIYSPGGVIKHNDYDIVVTYEYQNGAYADFFAGCAASDALTALDKLRSGEETTVAFFGDSITVGAQASGALGQKAAPYQEGYAKLVFNALQLKFPDARMHYVNQSVGGKKSEWGLENLPSVLETNPDVLVLAFGMNDGATASKDYLKSMREMVKLARRQRPEVSIVLVAEFSPNPNLPMAKYGKRKVNRDGLFAIQKEIPNCAAVDVGLVSRAMVERKKFCDLSGNNINHPNDFLHRVYADAVLQGLGLGLK